MIPTRRSVRRRVVTLVVFAALYLLLDGLAALDPLGPPPAAPWAPAPVLALAAVYCAGSIALPLAAALPLVAGLAWHGAPVWAGAPLALLQGLCFGVAGLLMRYGDFQGRLERLRDVVMLIVTVSVTALVSALTHGAAVAAEGGGLSAIGRAAAGLFFSQAVAAVAILPLLLLTCQRGLRPWRGRPSWETLLQFLSLVILSWEIFGQFVNHEVRFFYLLFLPFAWIAARHGVAGSAGGLSVIYGALMVSHWLLVHEPGAVVELQVRMLALAVISLLLAAIVSERRSAEQQLLARQSELAHVLRLNIGWEMASGLAHELNQPLTAAMSYNEAGVRLLRAHPPNPDKALSAFTKAVAQIQRASDIIRRLRDFMKKGEISVAATPLAAIVDDAVRMVRTEPAADLVMIQTHLPPGLPPVLADKIQIVQVILNLVRNGVQAIAGSGAVDGVIRLTARLDGPQVTVTVTDTGPGIPADVAPRLFDPFVTSKASGMGLGLSISKSIIEAHGGRLWLDAPAGRQPSGQGTAFRFTLPVTVA